MIATYGDQGSKNMINACKAAKNNNATLKEYTSRFTSEFFKDLQSLNIKEATEYPRATDYIDDIESHIMKLQNEDYCYERDGSYYYSINRFSRYGSLSGLEISNQKNRSRLNEDEYTKDNAQDFALWKAWDKDDGDVYWEGKLGKGRPGWHIECSVMSTKILGEEPILLLDDIMSELDKFRQSYIMDRLTYYQQCIVTSAESGMFNESTLPMMNSFIVDNGSITRQF